MEPRSAPEPRVSIVIVASTAGPLLERCLERLATLDTPVPFETIVVLNGVQPDGVPSARIGRAGLRCRVESSSVNLGLAGALNLARTLAHGEFIVSLHDDAQVQPGWLDALVETADGQREAGAVGSLVLDERDCVTAAGWELLPDGRTRPPWREEPPPAHAFAGTRPVDYCPSCSLLVRTATWDRLGGADERLFPLYYVDVDLCLAIRARGERVLVEPRSVVVHPGGSSTDRDFALFVAERNRRLLLEKWGDVLRAHEPGAGNTFAVAESELPAQEWHSDRELRWHAQLARHYSVGNAYASDLRTRLAERSRELDEAVLLADQLRDAARTTEAEAKTMEAELAWLRERSDRLAVIEQSSWFRLGERLLPRSR
jgi:GT2 family glycosyltransferase